MNTRIGLSPEVIAARGFFLADFSARSGGLRRAPADLSFLGTALTGPLRQTRPTKSP